MRIVYTYNVPENILSMLSCIILSLPCSEHAQLLPPLF